MNTSRWGDPARAVGLTITGAPSPAGVTCGHVSIAYFRPHRRLGAVFAMRQRPLTWAVLWIALTGIWSAASATGDPVIDPDVRAAVAGGTARVLVELRMSAADPVTIGSFQDEVLRRLVGTGARLARRFSTAPLLGLEIDGSALMRLETMGDVVTRVRADQIMSPSSGRLPSR